MGKIPLIMPALRAAAWTRRPPQAPAVFRHRPVWSAGYLASLMVLWLACWMPLGHAQSEPDADDPPARVARLAAAEGAVTLQLAGQSDAHPPQFTRPLLEGDRIQLATKARAELYVGPHAFRLGNGANLRLERLFDARTQASLSQGSLYLQPSSRAPVGMIEVWTPNLTVRLLQAGDYRIDVDPANDSTTLTVRQGQMTVYGYDSGTMVLTAPQWVRFGGTRLDTLAGNPYLIEDAFDRWAQMQERMTQTSISARYVSPELPGYAQLDQYGEWQTDPEYGPVWSPRLALDVDWAPYQDGHWVWIAPWGWTWVDDAPWGFIPFHYGRWAWVPGAHAGYAARPVYAPALVGFIDTDSIRFSIGIGAGIAWFPLGPYDPYHPAYRVSQPYLQRVNRGIPPARDDDYDASPWHHRYGNRFAPHAIIAIPSRTLFDAEPVQRHARRLDGREWSGWPRNDREQARHTPDLPLVAPPDREGRTPPYEASRGNRRPPDWTREDSPRRSTMDQPNGHHDRNESWSRGSARTPATLPSDMRDSPPGRTNGLSTQPAPRFAPEAPPAPLAPTAPAVSTAPSIPSTGRSARWRDHPSDVPPDQPLPERGAYQSRGTSDKHVSPTPDDFSQRQGPPAETAPARPFAHDAPPNGSRFERRDPSPSPRTAGRYARSSEERMTPPRDLPREMSPRPVDSPRRERRDQFRQSDRADPFPDHGVNPRFPTAPREDALQHDTPHGARGRRESTADRP